MEKRLLDKLVPNKNKTCILGYSDTIGISHEIARMKDRLEMFERDFKASDEDSKLNLADVRESFNRVCKVILSKDIEIGKDIDGHKRFIYKKEMVRNTNRMWDMLRKDSL